MTKMNNTEHIILQRFKHVARCLRKPIPLSNTGGIYPQIPPSTPPPNIRLWDSQQLISLNTNEEGKNTIQSKQLR